MKKINQLFSIGLGLTLAVSSFATLDEAMQSEAKKQKAAEVSQQQIDALSDEERRLFDEYQTQLKLVQDLKVYNRKLELQVEKQQQRIEQIEQSIADVKVMQRQILPFTEDMIASLEAFIALDLPFLQEERSERIGFLKANLERPELSIAEKFRQVLEAYRIESEYGRKIFTYEDSIEVQGQKLDVTVLCIGRLAMMFQTPDQQLSGVWDRQAKKWVIIESDAVANAIRKGIRMDLKQVTQDILQVPLFPFQLSTGGKQ